MDKNSFSWWQLIVGLVILPTIGLAVVANEIASTDSTVFQNGNNYPFSVPTAVRISDATKVLSCLKISKYIDCAAQGSCTEYSISTSPLKCTNP